ncbi:tetratricopeptide repeat protein [Nonomuraea sp. NPDC050643]|uniref:ATP-binding protein n=1 Tax=Nonomuraea sp. NPDC050643 TaxID=3155660 RepID=UPI0033C542A8
MASGAHGGAVAGPLGALLRSWRERALLTQEQLAARAGLNVRSVRRLEAGELRRPRSTSVRSLAAALELDDAELAALTRAANANAEDSRRAADESAPGSRSASGTAEDFPPAGSTPWADGGEGSPHVVGGRVAGLRWATGSGGPRREAPRQLPVDVPAFVGRARELALLGEVGDAATVVITAIDGMAGVGKTALAVHAAHRLAPRFPDGDLFVDLHGYTQGVAAADPADTLARVLGVLGVPGESIPQHADDRAALYRSVLAGRRMLIVLDNAADEAQVRPLLPGVGGCVVLVTSRRRLVGLDDARTVSVDVLPLADAIALFTQTAGAERVAGAARDEPAEVVRRCGLLPLAIRLAAARLKAHPAWSVGHLLERLEEHRRRLGELRAGQRSIAAALDLSYRELGEAERRAYRLLGLHAGVDIAPEAAAALLDTTPAQAGRSLDRLLEAHLLQEPVPGRYRFHDLIRAHAATTAAGEEPEADRRAALTRLLDHYSRAASAAMDRLYPYEADTRPRPPSGTASMPDVAAATAWLDAELANLLALAQHGLPGHVLHLSATLHRCLFTRGRYAEAEGLHTRALSVARATADRLGEAEALIALGEISRMQSRRDRATEDITRALTVARAIGHCSGEVRALNSLGMILGVQGQYTLAARHFTQALAIATAIGHRTGELDALIACGNVHRLLGQHEQCVADLTRALGIARSIGHRIGELRALIGLGRIHLKRGGHEPAIGYFTRALSLARDAGHRLGELSVLNALGDLHRAEGRHERARDGYRRALDLAREIGNRNWQFEAVHSLGRLQLQSGRAEQALESHRQALALATDLDQPSDRARAHDGLAHAHAALDRPGEACRHWIDVLTILSGLGIDRTEEQGVDVESVRAHLVRHSA